MPQNISSCLLLYIIIVSQIVPYAIGGNILFFTNAFSSHSHRVGLEPLALKLADRGHNITFITPLKSKVQSQKPHPNITEFCTKEIYDANLQFLKQVGFGGVKTRVSAKYTSGMQNSTWMLEVALKTLECTVKSGEVHKLFQSSKFDMLILDKSSMGEAIFGFTHKFNVSKIIYYSGAATLMPWEHDLHGIPNEISWVPSMQSKYQTRDLSFWDRLQSEISILMWYFGYTLYYLPKADKLIRDELNLKEMPPLQDLAQSESLILLNGHYSDTFPRSTPPFIVDVGGMHLQESSGILPFDLESFLSPNDSEETAEFVYVSLGSVYHSSYLPPKLVGIFLEAFQSLKPLKFMWKWESELPENIPPNVLLQNWFPQNDVLAHPNIRGFVTQGGQVSIQQAVYHGVPLIIFPVEGDQDYNAKRVRSAGNGIEMEFFDLTVETLREAINTLLINKSYFQAASKLSKASKQRPMHPLDLAVWWTEFVLTQSDVSYLRPQTKNVPWWMTRSLDVWAFIFATIIFLLSVALVCFCFGLKIMLNVCFSNST